MEKNMEIEMENGIMFGAAVTVTVFKKKVVIIIIILIAIMMTIRETTLMA